jgi:hypothetical protein
MARCDQGYLCRVCGDEVDEITESSLYLRYVIGEIDPEVLHLAPESHLQCTPTLAQFIAQRKELVTRGYQRLWEIRANRAHFRAVNQYPLPEIIDRWRT